MKSGTWQHVLPHLLLLPKHLLFIYLFPLHHKLLITHKRLKTRLQLPFLWEAPINQLVCDLLRTSERCMLVCVCAGNKQARWAGCRTCWELFLKFGGQIACIARLGSFLLPSNALQYVYIAYDWLECKVVLPWLTCCQKHFSHSFIPTMTSLLLQCITFWSSNSWKWMPTFRLD